MVESAITAMVDLLVWNIPGATTLVFQAAWMVKNILQFFFVAFPFLVTLTSTSCIVVGAMVQANEVHPSMNEPILFHLTVVMTVASAWWTKFFSNPILRDSVVLGLVSILLFHLYRTFVNHRIKDKEKWNSSVPIPPKRAEATPVIEMVDLLVWHIPGATALVFLAAWMVGKMLRFQIVVLPFLVASTMTSIILRISLQRTIEEQQYTNAPILFHATVVKKVASMWWNTFVSDQMLRGHVILFLVSILLLRLYQAFVNQITTDKEKWNGTVPIPAKMADATAVVAAADLLVWDIVTTLVFLAAWVVGKILQFIFVVLPFLVASTWTLYILIVEIQETNYRNGQIRFLLTLWTRVSHRWWTQFVLEPCFRDHVLLFMASILLFLLHWSNNNNNNNNIVNDIPTAAADRKNQTVVVALFFLGRYMFQHWK
jgi:hypothetical protein